MRILQVVHGFPPHEWAGTELVTLHLSQALRARGHEVTVFTRTAGLGEEFSASEEQVDGLAVVRVINNYTQTTTFRLSYENSFFYAPFIQLLDRIQPEIVHFQHVQHLSVSLIPLTVALGYPVVLSLHDFFFSCHRIHLLDAQTRLCAGPERGTRCVPCLQEFASAEEVQQRFSYMEQALHLAEVVLTPSEFLAGKIRSHFSCLGERLRAVPLGVHPISANHLERAPGTPLRILYVGVFLPHKGAHILIEALKGLPPERFTASLYGAVVPTLRAYADRLREEARALPVQFFDSYPHGQVASILSQHDVLVMPMIWEETFSILTREALLAGLPVVAARRGALPEAIHDGVNGLLFEPEDATDLRRCLTRLLTEPDLLETLRATRLHVKTPEEYARGVEAIYAEIVTEAAGGSLFSAERRQTQATMAARHLVRDLSKENSTLRQECAALRATQILAGQERDHLQQERDHLQQEQARLQQEWDRMRQKQERLQQEYEDAAATLRELADILDIREEQLLERDARLNAIYTSTTWKLYRGYAVLMNALFHRPLGVLRRWLSG
jgi:glycosyltransferase involved in cell wall biosynthesis